ncbi:MAG: GNAT family N-acetyltransferase [Chloroflexia bacterium]|nr:GNAT family N-acetyltransferase [Chloroflexia bacterium]
MRLTFGPMSEEVVRLVAVWTYEPPYDIYNLASAPIDELVSGLTDPANGYYAIADETGDIIAFCCFGPDARVPGGDYAAPAIDIGIGLRPDLTGQGLGPGVIGAALDFAEAVLGGHAFRVTIAAFNRRSIRAFEKLGFDEKSRFVGGSGPQQREWVILRNDDGEAMRPRQVAW